MEKKLSILFIGTQMATGGAQKILLDQARWFHEHGHEVMVAFFYDKENLYEKWQQGVGFTIIPLRTFADQAEKRGSLIGLISSIWRFWRLLRRVRFDVIEAFTPDSNILALPIAWLEGVPVRIATHHGSIERFPQWRRTLHTLLVNSGIVSILVAVSRRTKNIAVNDGILDDRIVIVQNGIEPLDTGRAVKLGERRKLGLGEDILLLISVGRLVYQKAHDVLIRAMPVILKDFPNVKLGICGEGFLRPKLETQISDMNLFESVFLLGNRDNVGEYLMAADIYVLPSHWEGMSIALLEAMSAGLPVVATNVEGVDDVMENGKQGLLVAVDDPRALAEAILQLLRFPEARRSMGSAARERVERVFTINRMCMQYLDVMLKYYKIATHNNLFLDNQ